MGQRIAVVVALFGLWSVNSVAQELVPRVYWPAPKGTNILVFGYQYSSGDIVTDPTLPITGVDSKINYAQVSYQRTLDLFGRTANFQLNLPYAWGSTEGVVSDKLLTRNLSATSDARLLLSVNLRGAPSMDRASFASLRANPKTIVGASILIQPPTGAYSAQQLINTGTNRWATKLALGVILPLRRDWLLEADAGVWFFGENDEFLGTTRQQDPIVSAQLHLVKRIRPGFWGSLDVNYYYGGESRVGQKHQEDLQRNSRMGVTFVFPLKGRHAIRTSYDTGIATKSGGDYSTFTVSYVIGWSKGS